MLRAVPDASGTGYNLVYSCSCYCTLWVFLEAGGREVTEEPVKIVKIKKFKTGATCIGSNATSNMNTAAWHCRTGRVRSEEAGGRCCQAGRRSR